MTHRLLLAGGVAQPDEASATPACATAHVTVHLSEAADEAALEERLTANACRGNERANGALDIRSNLSKSVAGVLSTQPGLSGEDLGVPVEDAGALAAGRACARWRPTSPAT